MDKNIPDLERLKTLDEREYEVPWEEFHALIAHIESLEKKAKAGKELYTDVLDAYEAYEVGVDEVSLVEAITTYRKQVE
jgi:hypothetical protein